MNVPSSVEYERMTTVTTAARCFYRVVCRQLGFTGGSYAYTSAHFGRGSGPIIMDDLHCTGFESTLAFCPHRGWLNHSCNHGEDAGVSCGAPG